MESGALGKRRPAKRARRIAILPTTEIGWWSVRLAAASIVLVLAWSVLPGGAALGFVLALAGGIVALVAITRRRERAITVFAAILPLVQVVVFVLAELLIGHD